MQAANPSNRWLCSTLACGALLFLATACSPTTSTTQTWSAEVPARHQLRSLLVIGTGPGVVDRRQLEDTLVADLAKRGVVAKASYQLFPYVPDYQQAREVAVATGLDGILTSQLRRLDERKRYVPATETHFTHPEYGAYARSSPGYYVNEESAEFETTLWEPRDNAKLWTAITRTDNATSERLSGSLADEVLPGLEKAGFVPRERR